MITKYFPIIKVQYNNKPYITGPDGTKHIPWIFIGRIKSKDNLNAYQIIVGYIHIAFSFIK